MPFLRQHKVNITWSSNFAYAIGLIASDGCLSTDGRHIYFSSIDKELIDKFLSALNITNTIFIGHSGTGGQYYATNFGDIVFYTFLYSIGLTRAKSKTIKKVDVPDRFFGDFFRGIFDGDGSFYSFWDKRWPHSFDFRLTLASASWKFLEWIKAL
jgi:hypothetical protein